MQNGNRSLTLAMLERGRQEAQYEKNCRANIEVIVSDYGIPLLNLSRERPIDSNPPSRATTRANQNTLENLGLTRPRSATAGGSERGLQWKCFHKVKRGSTRASGWPHRMVRCLGCESPPTRSENLQYSTCSVPNGGKRISSRTSLAIAVVRPQEYQASAMPRDD